MMMMMIYTDIPYVCHKWSSSCVGWIKLYRLWATKVIVKVCPFLWSLPFSYFWFSLCQCSPTIFVINVPSTHVDNAFTLDAPIDDDAFFDIDDNDENDLNSYSIFNDIKYVFDKWSPFKMWTLKQLLSFLFIFDVTYIPFFCNIKIYISEWNIYYKVNFALDVISFDFWFFFLWNYLHKWWKLLNIKF